jgi:hypothetical protein
MLVLVACRQAPVGVERAELASDTTPRCAEQCSRIGLTLDSVVIMAENVGCVCRAALPPGQTSASTAGGMTAIMLAEQARQEAEKKKAAEEEQRKKQQQQQQEQQKI